jgi:PAS domain S-box-containing protein
MNKINLYRFILMAGSNAEDNVELIQKKRVLNLITAILFVAGSTWAFIYTALGFYTAALVPLSFIILLSLNFSLYCSFKSLEWYLRITCFLMLFTPFFFQWLIGGFENGGGVGLWSAFAPIGMLVFEDRQEKKYQRENLGYLVGFIFLLFFSCIFNEYFRERVKAPALPLRLGAFFVTLAAVPSVLHFLLKDYVRRQEIAKKQILEYKTLLEGMVSELQKREVELNENLVALEEAKEEIQIMFEESQFMQEKIQNVNSYLSSILDNAEYLIISTDANEMILQFNKSAERFLEYSKEEVIGKVNPIIFHDPLEVEQKGKPLNVAPALSVVFPPQIEANTVSGEWTYISKTGKRYPMMLSITKLWNEKTNEFGGYLLMAYDRTAQKAYEQELKAKNAMLLQREEELQMNIEELRAIQEDLADKNKTLEKTLLELKQTQNKLIVSEKMASLGQLISGVAHEMNTPVSAIQATARIMSEQLRQCLSGFPAIIELLDSEQKAAFLELAEQVLQSVDNKLTTKEQRLYRRELEQILTEFNLTDPRDMAEELVSAKIYKNLAQYSSLLSHSQIELILSQLCLIGKLKNGLSNIEIASTKALQVVKALRNYSHTQNTENPISYDLIENIETILTLMESLLKHGIEIEKEYNDIPKLIGYPEQVGQIWTNLITNAVHAMNGKGKIAIQVACQTPSTVSVTITDNGPGIPPEIQDRIFEPFFTTKQQGQGTGLGLDICRKILEQSGGKISFTSVPGRTSFQVELPIKPS